MVSLDNALEHQDKRNIASQEPSTSHIIDRIASELVLLKSVEFESFEIETTFLKYTNPLFKKVK